MKVPNKASEKTGGIIMTTKTTEKKQVKIVNDQKELAKMLAYRHEMKALIEEAEASVKEIDEAIKAFMTTLEEPSALIGDYKVTLSTFVKESVQAKALRELVSEEIFEQVVTRTLVTRLTVK